MMTLRLRMPEHITEVEASVNALHEARARR
jgi:hypothetical protein